jgi:hypothetical protein
VVAANKLLSVNCGNRNAAIRSAYRGRMRGESSGARRPMQSLTMRGPAP